MGESEFGIVGGHQSPKPLLDAVLMAVVHEDVKGLQELKDDFNAVPENITKCVDPSGNNLAHLAIHKSTATLEFVVEELRADVNGINIHGKTPLHVAVRGNFAACCRYLLEHGARDDATTFALSTVFHTAAACGSIECMELLVSHAENPSEKLNEADKNASTALHKCCYDGDVRVAQWLLSRKASVDAVDKRGCTPLQVATKMGRLDVVKLLLDFGADAKHVDNEGRSALHDCASRCLPDIAHLLIANGAQVKVHDTVEYNTPLHTAAINAQPENPDWVRLVLELLRAGESQGAHLLDLQNTAGKRAVDYVGRTLVPLFSIAEVERRAEESAKLAKQLEQKRLAAIAERKQQLQEQRQQLQDKATHLKEEEERKHREAEERVRVEEDARYRRDEEAEQKRLEEEEAKRAKAKKAKAGGKGK